MLAIPGIGHPFDAATLLKTLMFQRLPIALAKVKAGHTFGNLLNEIHQFGNYVI